MNTIDLEENNLPRELLVELLKDHTTGKNIFWASSDYKRLGKGFSFFDQIETTSVTGRYAHVVMPRVLKSKELKKKRTLEKAEIFTPAWVCNEMCNAWDEAYRARDSHFNEPIYKNGKYDWELCPYPIRFADGISWQDYVLHNTLEITCGEAPYIVSRYDVATGEAIDLERRIGLLDRKLRVICENVTSFEKWMQWVVKAFQSSYGYEWQGDNILLARENLMCSFVDYYEHCWKQDPSQEELMRIAQIISWNIFQMDGLKMVIPESCKNGVPVQSKGLFGNEEKVIYCEGCKKNNPKKHNGIPAMIMDWSNNRVIEFRSLYKSEKDI